VSACITYIQPAALDTVMTETDAQASRNRIRALPAGQLMRGWSDAQRLTLFVSSGARRPMSIRAL